MRTALHTSAAICSDAYLPRHPAGGAAKLVCGSWWLVYLFRNRLWRVSENANRSWYTVRAKDSKLPHTESCDSARPKRTHPLTTQVVQVRSTCMPTHDSMAVKREKDQIRQILLKARYTPANMYTNSCVPVVPDKTLHVAVPDTQSQA